MCLDKQSEISHIFQYIFALNDIDELKVSIVNSNIDVRRLRIDLGNQVIPEIEQFINDIKEPIQATPDFISIDLNMTRRIYIENKFLDFNENNFFTFDLFEDGKVAFIYRSESKIVKISIIDPEKSTHISREVLSVPTYKMSLKTVKTSLIFEYTEEFFCETRVRLFYKSHLFIFNSDLQVLYEKIFSNENQIDDKSPIYDDKASPISSMNVHVGTRSMDIETGKRSRKIDEAVSSMNADVAISSMSAYAAIISIDADESNIYCFMYNYTINVLDHELTTIRKLRLANFPNDPFYLTIKSIDDLKNSGMEK